MGFVERIAPSYALRRKIAASRLERYESALIEFNENEARRNNVLEQRSFDMASPSRMNADFFGDSSGANTSIQMAAGTLRNQVRHLEQNNGMIAGPIKRMVNNVVGQGIRFQSVLVSDETSGRSRFPKISEIDAEQWIKETEWNWKSWVMESDLRLMQTFYEQQRIIEGALIRDGACLVIGRISDRRGRLIPYTVEVLEIDRLQTPFELSNDPKVRNGIIYDNEGVPKTYLILKAHPGETFMMGWKASDYEEIPAYFDNGNLKVMHLFNPVRPEQEIGYSEFASGLKDLHDLDRYMEAEKMAALEDACLTGIVTTPNPAAFNSAFTQPAGSSSESYQRIHEFAPLKWHYLRPGQDVEIHGPQRPNSQFADYIKQLKSGPANGLDMPPEVFSQDWGGLNYSNARTILINLYSACMTRQTYLRDHLCIPVWENVGTWFVIKGLVQARGFDRRKKDYLASKWIPSVYRKWVDPLKESKGAESDLVNNIDTLTDILAERGKDFDEHIEIRAREIKKIQEKEELHGIKFPTSSAKAVPEKSDENIEDENEKGDDNGEEKRSLLRVM